MLDRSSAPARVANRTPEDRVQTIACLRRLRFTGPEVAELLGMALSTVSGILTRIGMGKLGRLGLEPARRYERERPGELVHVDVKKLGRIERGAGKPFIGRTHHTSHPTDPLGVSPRQRRLGMPSRSCAGLGIRQLRTHPYRPQTNAKAERFIRTMLGGWAYAAIYRTSAERTAALDGWLWHYNNQRKHSALGHKPPHARLTERTNLIGTYI